MQAAEYEPHSLFLAPQEGHITEHTGIPLCEMQAIRPTDSAQTQADVDPSLLRRFDLVSSYLTPNGVIVAVGNTPPEEKVQETSDPAPKILLVVNADGSVEEGEINIPAVPDPHWRLKRVIHVGFTVLDIGDLAIAALGCAAPPSQQPGLDNSPHGPLKPTIGHQPTEIAAAARTATPLATMEPPSTPLSQTRTALDLLRDATTSYKPQGLWTGDLFREVIRPSVGILFFRQTSQDRLYSLATTFSCQSDDPNKVFFISSTHGKLFHWGDPIFLARPHVSGGELLSVAPDHIFHEPGSDITVITVDRGEFASPVEIPPGFVCVDNWKPTGPAQNVGIFGYPEAMIPLLRNVRTISESALLYAYIAQQTQVIWIDPLRRFETQAVTSYGNSGSAVLAMRPDGSVRAVGVVTSMRTNREADNMPGYYTYFSPLFFHAYTQKAR